MSKKSFAISMLGFVLVMSPVWGTSCTSSTNPCTNGSSSGPDTADRTTFNSDTLNTAADIAFTNIDFNSLTSSNTNNYTSGLAIDGLTFTGLDSNGTSPDLYVEDVDSWGSNLAEQHNSGGSITVIIPLTSNVYAFGVDLLDIGGSPAAFFVSVNGGSQMESASNPGALPSSVFFGYTSATPITSVTITPLFASDYLGIDNFEFGQEPAPTPEVSTMLLIGTGLILMRFMNRRQKRKAAKQEAGNPWKRDRSPMAMSV